MEERRGSCLRDVVGITAQASRPDAASDAYAPCAVADGPGAEWCIPGAHEQQRSRPDARWRATLAALVCAASLALAACALAAGSQHRRAAAPASQPASEAEMKVLPAPLQNVAAPAARAEHLLPVPLEQERSLDRQMLQAEDGDDLGLGLEAASSMLKPTDGQKQEEPGSLDGAVPREVLEVANSSDEEQAEAWGADAESLLPEGEVCNVQAELPKASAHSHDWSLSPSWRRACEKRNLKDEYPNDRNWCWVGYKQECHWNLKAHIPWGEFQSMAAKKGIAPPPRDLPYLPLANPEVCDRPELGQIRNWTQEEMVTARDWFKRNVAVYVLSLPSSTERWKMIKARLDELQIWATRVYGVDMRVEGALQRAKSAGWVPEEFNFTRTQELAYSWKHGMGSILGTLGCASAHFKVQTQAIADGSPLAVVFEDDSWPSDDFVPRLWSLVKDEIPCDWEVAMLLTRCGYGQCVSPHLMRVEPDTNEPAWRCHQGVNWGMHAVLYRTKTLKKLQEKWKKVVFDEERPRCMDVDVALASMSDQAGVYAVPAVQDPGFVSEGNHESARWDINQAAQTTETSTTMR